jgi:hypothetical protein
MLDLFYIGVCLAFFLLSAWMVRGFTKLQPEADDE